LFDDVCRSRECPGDGVLIASPPLDGHVAGRFIVYERRAGREGSARIADRWQGRVFDLHAVRRIARDVRALRDHDRDCFTDVSDVIGRQSGVRRGEKALDLPCHGNGPDAGSLEVPTRPCAENASRRQCATQVDCGDAGVSVRTAHECRMDSPCGPVVIREVSSAGDESRVSQLASALHSPAHGESVTAR
jgi:hypothetical protein